MFSNFSFDYLLIVSVSGILIMLYNLVLAIKLRRKAPGGIVGKTWGILAILVFVFAAGYLVTPFLHKFSIETLRLFVGMIFLFGAIYVTITIKLIHRIITALTE